MRVYYFYLVFFHTVFSLGQAIGDLVFNEESAFKRQPGGKIFLKDHIVRGQPARYGQFPYLAHLELQTDAGFLECGGSLISKYWILTAAHCLKPERGSRLHTGQHTGILGKIEKIFNHKQVFNLIDPVVHNGWSIETQENDIAMIRLERKILDWKNIKITKLSHKPFYGSTAVVAGWGFTDIHGQQSTNFLKFIRQKILNLNSCPILFSGVVVDERVLCAKALKAGESTCKGDSGSPLVVNYGGELLQVGLVSYGTIACDASQPDIYTSVSYFRSWVIQIILQHSRFDVLLNNNS